MDQPAAINPSGPAVPPASPAHGTHAEIPHDLFCQDCGYNLRGLTSNRCPECGHKLDSVRSTLSGIPWVHRRDIGRIRAFWRTVWLVMFRHKRFCEELARPVSYADAQSFRWTVILHVYASVLAATLGAYALYWPALFDDPFWDRAFAAVWPILVLQACFILFLAAATGVPSYFFALRELPIPQQNSAISMSYYAAAALAWTPAGLVFAMLAVLTLPHRQLLGEALVALAISLPSAAFVAWWADVMHVAARILPIAKWRALLIGLQVLGLWALLAGLIFTCVPLAILYVLIVLSSLS